MFQTFQLQNATFDMGSVFFFQIAQLGLQFGAKATQTARPAIAATDDGGIDQQFFPANRHVEWWRLVDGGGCRRRGRVESAKDFVISGDPLARANLRRAVGMEGRRLAERKIFGEARSGTAFAGARQ